LNPQINRFRLVLLGAVVLVAPPFVMPSHVLLRVVVKEQGVPPCLWLKLPRQCFWGMAIHQDKDLLVNNVGVASSQELGEAMIPLILLPLIKKAGEFCLTWCFFRVQFSLSS
jgi:hypothetical protein